MTEEEREEYENAKEIVFDYIKENTFLYKICEGCESIVYHSRTFCPVCRGYNFDSGRKRVLSQVRKARKEGTTYFDV